MNEPIVQRTKGIATSKFLQQSYVGSHLLANGDYSTPLLEFIIKAQVPGTVATVDSYLFDTAEITVDQAYELEVFAACWPDSLADIVPDLLAVPVTQEYANVIAVGQWSFKYKTPSEYAEYIEHLLKITQHNGSLVVCLPKLHLNYHRLQYQPQDLITELNKLITGSITESIELGHDFYLKIEK